MEVERWHCKTPGDMLNTTRLLVRVSLLALLLHVPRSVLGQDVAQQLIQLDNSGCPEAQAKPFGLTMPDSATMSAGESSKNSAPDIILLASVSADRVRFAKKPEIRVRLCWGGDEARVVERTNLPSPVVPGTTYTNVFINVEILGHLNAQCLSSRITGSQATSENTGPCAGISAGVNRSGSQTQPVRQ